MSDVRAQSIVVLYWSMMLAGAGLSGFGLFRSLTRYRGWRTATEQYEGEIVIGDGRLKVGLPLVLSMGRQRVPDNSAGSGTGSIVAITAKHYVIELDDPLPDLRQALGGTQAACRVQSGARIESLFRPLPGTEVTVSVSTATAVYQFTARVRDLRTSVVGIRIIVARPSILARIQRRKHARAELCAPATFERVRSKASSARAGEDRLLTYGPIYHGTIRDMSGGGLRAQIGSVTSLREIESLLQQFQPDETVRIGLPIPVLCGAAVLARVRTSGIAVTVGGLTVQVAFEYLPMPEWEREAVIQYVFGLHREKMRTAKTRRHDGQPGICQ